MPKIKITEIDSSSTGLSVAADNVVYIPGPALLGEEPAVAGEEATAPVLYMTAAELDAGAATNKYDTTALSFKLAKYLIDTYGFYVLYEGLANGATTVPASCWTALQDRGSYSIRFLTTGQYGGAPAGVDAENKPTGGIDAAMVTCAKKRGDCIALYDHPENTATVEAVRGYFAGITANGEYAAGFTPWFETSVAAFGKGVAIPASFGYLFAYGRTIQNYPEWYAVAGPSRGLISEISAPTIKYSESDCEILQSRSASGEVALDAEGDNASFAINPIAPIRPFGYIIWGNRTLLTPTNAGLKATSFLNIRNMICTIKKVMFQAARRFTFDQNNDMLWINFSSAIIPTLENMKSGEGLLGYKFRRVATSKKARLKANLVIVPIEAVEDFEINLELTDSIETIES